MKISIQMEMYLSETRGNKADFFPPLFFYIYFTVCVMHIIMLGVSAI